MRKSESVRARESERNDPLLKSSKSTYKRQPLICERKRVRMSVCVRKSESVRARER